MKYSRVQRIIAIVSAQSKSRQFNWTHTLENGFEKLKKKGKFPALPDDNYNGVDKYGRKSTI